MSKTRKIKADCTPEEWAEYLAYHREWRAKNAERERANRRAYTSREDVKERRRIADSAPDRVKKRRDYAATDEAKARAKELYELKRADPERWAKRLANQRRRRTGFTQELMAKTLSAQGDACAVCRRPFTKVEPVGDHCHESGKPRGILCRMCNTVEGQLKKLEMTPTEFANRLEHYLSNPTAVY